MIAPTIFLVLLSWFILLLAMRAFEIALGRRRSDLDVVRALLVTRETKIRAAALVDYEAKYDILRTDKLKAEKDRDHVVAVNARLNGELRRKHRRVIVE